MVMEISGLPDLAENDDGNYIKANDGLDASARIAHATHEVDCSAGGTIALVKNGLPSDSYIQGYRFKLTGAPAAAFNLQLPDGDRRLEVWNASGQDATVDTATGSASTITVKDGARRKIVVDGIELALDDAAALGRQTVVIPAGAMQPTASNGCAALATAEIAAGGINVAYLAFDGVAEEKAQFAFTMPKSWDLGALRFLVKYSHAGGQAGGSDGVAWSLKAVARGDGDALTGGSPWGGEVTVTKDAAGADTEHVTAESADVTPGGTPAVGDRIYFEVARKVDNGADDLNIDARLHEVVIFYETNAGSDA